MGKFHFQNFIYIYSIYFSKSRKFCKFFLATAVFMRVLGTYVKKNHVRETYILPKRR